MDKTLYTVVNFSAGMDIMQATQVACNVAAATESIIVMMWCEIPFTVEPDTEPGRLETKILHQLRRNHRNRI